MRKETYGVVIKVTRKFFILALCYQFKGAVFIMAKPRSSQRKVIRQKYCDMVDIEHVVFQFLQVS